MWKKMQDAILDRAIRIFAASLGHALGCLVFQKKRTVPTKTRIMHVVWSQIAVLAERLRMDRDDVIVLDGNVVAKLPVRRDRTPNAGHRGAATEHCLQDCKSIAEIVFE